MGAEIKVNAPVELSIVNLALSAPPVTEYVTVSPLSTSVRVTVVTAVVFSTTLIEAVAPPALDVMIGASFTAVISRFTTGFETRLPLPSVALIVIVAALLPLTLLAPVYWILEAVSR